MKRTGFILCFLMFALVVSESDLAAIQPGYQTQTSGLKISVFDVDVTPPIGYEMAFGKVVEKWDLGLRARGILLTGVGQPIILCAIDWHSIANEAQDAFRKTLADAAGTVPGRVTIHTLHQHDAPIIDFGAEKILKDAGIDPLIFNGDFAREVLINLAAAVKNSLAKAQPVTHIGSGQAKVDMVASNRRILGADGKVSASRSSSARSPELRAAPEGTVDPVISIVSFWNGEKPIAALSYFATHPQSYYRTGIPNPDFPGVARFLRQLEMPDVLNVHFNGAAGNVAAGKYNDGSHENRGILGHRMAEGMRIAWENTKLEPVSTVKWTVEPVSLPPGKHLVKLLEDTKENKKLLAEDRNSQKLAWYLRCLEGKKVDISCLTLGKVRILHLPGELFIEYQLAAKAQRPDLFVTMAAYGDFGPHYIGTSEAYAQGGYEIQSSDVAPEVENVLMTAIRNLLK